MTMAKNCLLIWFAATLLLTTQGCKDEGSQPPSIPERVKLTLIDAAVKEVYLHIAVTTPGASNETLALQRDGATVLAFRAVADTSIADTALTQTTSYHYTATLSVNNSTTGTSNAISAQTLAPTSHNFTWQTFLLGDGNGGALYDVALINDTLAYAVGEIYLSGDPLPYNLVKWNGTAWTLLRVQFSTICGQPSTTPYPAGAIWAVNENDIWIAMRGDQVARWNGEMQTSRTCLPVSFSIRKLWGSNSNSVYAVGDAGNLMYFGNTWQRLESGTRTSIFDTWGLVNTVTEREEVYCAAGDRLLRIRNTNLVDSVWGTNRTRDGIWTHEGFPIFTSGDGVFENSTGVCREVNIGVSIYTNGIRGSALNNIVAVGDFGLIAHFNGLSWHPFFENPAGDYYNVSVKENLIIAVGEVNSRGLILVGRRL
jgi:hypothetical protein